MYNLAVSRFWRNVTFVLGVGAALIAVLLSGCRSETPQQAETSAAGSTTASTESHEGHTMGKVFFVAPKGGETVKNPVRFEFGSENYQIAAVPSGEVTEARANMGHFHLGVDQDCLPANTEIPRGKPDWVHFGKGDNTIDMNLTPGQHKFAVQVGDDLHRTVEGLCETITINVE